MIRQSGAIPYRVADGVLEVLLITNKAGTRWLVPKGNIEPAMTPQESAAREAFEEAGVTGSLAPDSVGSFRYRRGASHHVVDLYSLAVETTLRKWPEMAVRRRAWVVPRKAIARIDIPGLAACIRSLTGCALSTNAA